MNRLSIGVLILGLIVVAGCSRTQNAQVRDGAENLGQQVQTAAEGAKEAASNAALAAKVKTAMGTRKGVNAGDINVDAKDGVVTLKGDVNSQAEADLAVEVAQQTEGVQSVNNQLMVRVPAKGATPPGPGTPGAGRS
jgi:osmotically-inducible protein OsmY